MLIYGIGWGWDVETLNLPLRRIELNSNLNLLQSSVKSLQTFISYASNNNPKKTKVHIFQQFLTYQKCKYLERPKNRKNGVSLWNIFFE